MLETLILMFALIAVGAGWARLAPGRQPVASLRSALTELVFYLLLPALVLRVMWQARLGLESIAISAAAVSGILGAMLVSWWLCRRCRLPDPVSGATILAAAFANVTYLGLPVLVATLGDWAAGVAIQYDLFASTPLLFTLGFLLAAHYGHAEETIHPLQRLVRIPALWAALLAVLLNLTAVPLPAGLAQGLHMLGDAVIPLMLLALGMSLQWRSLQARYLQPLAVVVFVQLLLMPVIVLLTSGLLQMDKPLQTAVVLEAAMPSMVIGLVLCEHYRLATGLYAAAVTVTTLLSMLSLPLWFALLA